MIEKGFTVLLIAFMIIIGCGMLYGRVVQQSPLPPQYALVQPDNQELVTAGKLAAGLQAADTVTQPVTVTLAVPVSVALFPPVDDDRGERAQVIWRLTFAAALGLIGVFLVVVVGIKLSFRR